MKRFKIVFALFFFIAVFMFSSCSRKMGYSVLLWDYPDAHLQDGEIVSVFIRSNISQVYVIEIPGTKERREIPLWQLTEPQSKRKAVRAARLYSDYRHVYASSRIDGLPIRAEASNIARSVYRLRQNEIIKILYDGKGQAVMAGEGIELEGKWLYVITSDGTRGWCFSYSLSLFETDASGGHVYRAETVVESAEMDEDFDGVVYARWYPEKFRTLVDDNTVDLSVINGSYGFYIDIEKASVSLKVSNEHEVWEYKGFTKTGTGSYQLTDIPVLVTVHSEDHIVVRYTGSTGRPQDFDFVTLDVPIEEIVSAETERRAELYAMICDGAQNYTSSNYGTIVFNENYTFSWKGYNLLVPSLIPSRAGTSGHVFINYIPSKRLAQNYDGVLTFRLANTSNDLNFLYSFDENGLRLEDASSAVIDGQIVMRRSSSPLVLFFQK